MSKFLNELKIAQAAFESIDFDAKTLEADPEALQAFLARQQNDGIEDLKTQIETLEAENEKLSADLAAAKDADIAAADELLIETQASLDKAEEQVLELSAALAAQVAATNLQTARFAALQTGLTDSGIKIEAAEGKELTADAITKAITGKIQTFTSEKLAALGFKGVLEDTDTHSADNLNEDPFKGLTGISKTAAAIKARRASRK